MDQLVGYVGVLNASNPSLQEDLSSTAKLTIYWLAIINMGRGVGGRAPEGVLWAAHFPGV